VNATAKQPHLQTIGQNPSLQASAKQANEAVFGDDFLDSLRVRNVLLVRLLGCLDHTDGVGYGVGHHRRAETHDGVATQAAQKRFSFRNLRRHNGWKTTLTLHAHVRIIEKHTEPSRSAC
jgi:hypothetical protein